MVYTRRMKRTRAKMILDVRFAANCTNVNTQNRKNDVIHSRRAKNHDTSGLRPPFHDRHPSSRRAAQPYVILPVRIYARVKKYTRANNALIHERPFGPSCVRLPVWMHRVRFYARIGKCPFKPVTHTHTHARRKKNPNSFFPNYQRLLMTLYIVCGLCFVTFRVTKMCFARAQFRWHHIRIANSEIELKTAVTNNAKKKNIYI